jgi:hypothetical protein
MPERQAAKTAEATVAAALANSMHRKHRGERAVDLSISAVVIINLLMLAGIAVDPHPYRWVMAVQIGLPWVSFALTWYFLDREQGGTSRFISLLFSSLFTSLVALIPFGYLSLLNRLSALVSACVAGLAVSAVLTLPALIQRRLSGIPAIILAGSLTLYCYVALFEINCTLDRSPAVVYASIVSAKRFVYRDPNRLQIRPWGRRSDFATVGVSPKAFRSVRAGDTICVVQRSGALHMPWFTAQTCPWTGGAVDLGPVGRLSRIW